MQISFNEARMDYLRHTWDTEVALYKKNLKGSRKSFRIISTLNKIPRKLIDHLLRLYLQRCKFKHTIVFTQFRKLLPKP